MPRIVLLPGMHGTGALFRLLLEAFPRGIGASVLSYPPDRALGYPELLALVRRKVAGSPPFVLVAESFSGPIAIEFAAARPPNLRGLVLCATFARNPLPPSLQWLRAAAQAALFRVRPPAAVVRSLLLGRDAPPDLVEAVSEATRRVLPSVMAHRLRQVLDVDVESALPGIAVPVLYLAGSADRLVGLRGLKRIAARLPGLESVVLEGPHLLLQARPGEAAREIVRFCGRL